MIERITSGGQTGVDRAALDLAIGLGLPSGGWCPAGRGSEDGPIDARYPLVETPSPDPVQRTEWNVRDSDGTLIIAQGQLNGGTALTRRFARDHDKPCLVVDPSAAGDPTPAARIGRWIAEHGIRNLNVAGPRESRRPGTYRQALDLLRSALLHETIERAFDYRGDVTIVRRSGESIEGYIYDRSIEGPSARLRIIPRDGGERVTIPCDDVAEIRFTGRDTAAGKSFETWMKKYVRKKLAGEEASIEAQELDELR